jgi:hypothetical protein
MTYGLLIPLPIVAAGLAANVLSPETHVPLDWLLWLLGGLAGSVLLAWRLGAAHNKAMGRLEAIEHRMTKIETGFERLLYEHDRRSSCLKLPGDKGT